MRRLATIIIFFLGFTALYLIDQWRLDHWRSEKALELDTALNLYKENLKNTILNRFKAIESLAALFILHPKTTPEDFSYFAAFLLQLNPPIRAIQYADSDTRVIYVYPPKGNEVTINKPMTLITDPKRGPFIKKAIQENTTILQGPFELRQGGTGVVVRFPIFKEKNFIGLSIGVYDLHVLAKEALRGLNFNRFAFRLKDTQGNVFWSSGKIFDEYLHKEINVAGATWIIDVNWLQPSTPPILSRVLIWFFGFGFFLTTLAFLQTAWRQEKQLKKEVKERIKDLSNSNKRLLSQIAERKQAETALRNSEEYLRAIYEAADNVAFVVTDLAGEDTKILDISPGAEKIFGYDRNEVVGKKVAIFHLPEVVKDFPKIQAELKKNKKGYSGETVLVRKTGEMFSALFTIFPRTNSTGNLIGTIGVSIDITERKKIEKDLQASEVKFSKAFLNAPLLMSISSIKDGRYIDVNNAFERVTGYTRDIAIASTSTEIGFINKEDRKRLIQELNATGRVDNIELELTSADGALVNCLYSGELIEVNGKQRLLSIASDITGRKKIEERLKQAQRMESIGNLAGGIAHDFNNILFPIVGMSEMLLEDLPAGSPERENAAEIFRAGKRGSDLVKQILAFSRQSDHKMVPTRVQHILKEVLTLSRSTIPTYVDIQRQIQPDCGMIMADPTQIHQVVMNIITNAYHAMEDKGGKITVQLKQVQLTDSDDASKKLEPGKYALLSISDTGYGISNEFIHKIFDPYFTTKEQGKGTGLGLAVVYGIVQEHKGNIKVHSEIGKGSTFDIYFPLMDKTEKAVSVRQFEDYLGGNERILLVDDEEPIAKLEKQVLERLGYKVTMRFSSLDALEAFKANPDDFDLVITDMTMPNMTGDRLARELIAIKPDTPIIICTGFSERLNQGKASTMGIKGFLMKPTVKSEMAKTVRKVLDEVKSRN